MGYFTRHTLPNILQWSNSTRTEYVEALRKPLCVIHRMFGFYGNFSLQTGFTKMTLRLRALLNCEHHVQLVQVLI